MPHVRTSMMFRRCAGSDGHQRYARIFEVQFYGVEQQDDFTQSDGTNSSYVAPSEALPNVALSRGAFAIADSVSNTLYVLSIRLT